jgi:hypothetical protein
MKNIALLWANMLLIKFIYAHYGIILYIKLLNYNNNFRGRQISQYLTPLENCG